MTTHRVRGGSSRALAWGTTIAIGVTAALTITGCSAAATRPEGTAVAHRSTTRTTASATSTPSAPATTSNPHATPAPSAAEAAAAASASAASASTSAAAAAAAAAAAPSTPSSAALVAMLQDAPVPALCRHTAGTLVHGTLPAQAGHAGTVALSYLVGTGRPEAALTSVGALEGAGSHDVVAGLYCDAGGVPWPEVVGVWRWTGGSTLRFVSVYAPEQLSHNIVSLHSIAVSGAAIDVTWTGPAPGKDDADGSEHSSAVLTLRGEQLVASGYHSTVV
ncbi:MULTISPECIES: hypothetical protein [unclassified Curtobacterium]|uniref:hypothetical protein n=1 Tax=unclassified Curtobacterium TaxID=257496 RepID=UPI0011B5EF24|nr:MULTISPECIES: hypothetical protein [unclassified Curtobacterium]WIE55858.1 hypothetical protein DEI88_006585 [Curtobacterium sp. MCBD17_003]